MNERTGTLTMKEKAEALLKRAQMLQTSLRKAVEWFKELSQAIGKGDWLAVRALFAQRVYEQIKKDGALGFSVELEEIEKHAQTYAVDAETQWMKWLKEKCNSAGITPVTEKRSRGMSVARLISLRLDPRTNQLHIETLSKKSSVSAGDREAAFSRIGELHNEIWKRPFDAKRFLQELYEAYADLTKDGGDAELGQVQFAYWKRLQPKCFFGTYDLSRAHRYTTDMFSADLARLLESGANATVQGKKLHLATHGGGVPVYDAQGKEETYKFIRFDQS